MNDLAREGGITRVSPNDTDGIAEALLVIRQHLDDFLCTAADRADGAGLPCAMIIRGIKSQHRSKSSRTWAAPRRRSAPVCPARARRQCILS